MPTNEFHAEAGGPDAPRGPARLGLGLALLAGVLVAASPVILMRADGLALGPSGRSLLCLATAQALAALLSGYLFGRLRPRSVNLPVETISLRDALGGLSLWGMAVLLTVSPLIAVTSGIFGAQVPAMPEIGRLGAGLLQGESELPITRSEFVAALLRKSEGGRDPEPNDAPIRAADMTSAAATELAVAEASRLFANALQLGMLAPSDLRYISRLVVRHSGLSPAAAEQRTQLLYERLRAAALAATQEARHTRDLLYRASAYAALWLIVALLLGAAMAAQAAVLGGRHRDA